MADYGIQNATHSFNLPSPYQADLNKLAQQQKMAELLQAQSLQPTERYSYKGIEARSPVTAGLAKMLQGFTAMQMQEKGLEEQKALGERYRQEGMDDITRYAEMAGKPAVAEQAEVPARMAEIAPEERAQSADYGTPLPGAAIPAVAARIRGQIDPSMIGGFKTPEMRQMALAQMLKQGELPAAFNLGAEETRFQPPVGGGAPVAVATGKAKPLPSPFAQINPKDYTPESLKLAIKPDGTVDKTLLVAVTAAPTGNIAEVALENADRKQKGLPPLSIGQYRERIAKASRPDAAVTYGAPVAATDAAGNAVFLQPGKTGNAPSVIAGYTPPVEKLRPIPPTINTAIIGNQTAGNQLDRAIALLSGKDLPGMVSDVNATGMKGYVPTGLLNRFDPQGVSARAEIADIGSLKLHDRSGAAVTASESPRLMPFIPLTTDDNATALKKLGRLKLEVENESKAMRDIYSKEQGYKENPVLNKPSVADKTTTIAEITDAAKKTGKTVDQVTKDAIAKGYKVNP